MSKPMSTRTRDAADRVQVRAVVVEERAGVVEDLRDLLDVLVEEAERGGFVSMSPAVRSSTLALRSSRSRFPRSSVSTFWSSKPAIATLAGFVP